MQNEIQIISTHWFRPEDEIYYFDGCSFIKSAGRVLLEHNDELYTKHFSDRYMHAMYDLHKERQIYFYPQMRTMELYFFRAYDLLLKDHWNDSNMLDCMQEAEYHYGLTFDKKIVSFVEDMEDGKEHLFAGMHCKPIGFWVTKNSKQEDFTWDGEDYFVLQSIKTSPIQ